MMQPEEINTVSVLKISYQGLLRKYRLVLGFEHPLLNFAGLS